MSSLSIVVPRLGPDNHFENTLASVLRYRMPHHQVVVLQSDLQADTYDLEDEVQFVEVSGKAKLTRYFNRMLDVVTGDTLNIVRPGVEVTHQWFAHAIRNLQNPAIGSVAATLVLADDREQVVSSGITTGRTMLPRHIYESRQTPLGPTCWAGFYRTRLLKAIGEVDESLNDNFVDLDLALSIRELGYGCEVVADRVLTIPCRHFLALPASHQSGRDAQRMVQRHFSQDRQKTGSLLAIGGEVLSSFWKPTHWPQIAGRFGAKSKRATDRAFCRRLEIAKHELAESEMAPVPPSTRRRAAKRRAA